MAYLPDESARVGSRRRRQFPSIQVRQLRTLVVVSGGAYFAALSRRLNSTCSNSTGSTITIGSSELISTSSSIKRIGAHALKAALHDGL